MIYVDKRLQFYNQLNIIRRKIDKIKSLGIDVYPYERALAIIVDNVKEKDSEYVPNHDFLYDNVTYYKGLCSLYAFENVVLINYDEYFRIIRMVSEINQKLKEEDVDSYEIKGLAREAVTIIKAFDKISDSLTMKMLFSTYKMAYDLIKKEFLYTDDSLLFSHIKLYDEIGQSLLSFNVADDINKNYKNDINIQRIIREKDCLDYLNYDLVKSISQRNENNIIKKKKRFWENIDFFQ